MGCNNIIQPEEMKTLINTYLSTIPAKAYKTIAFFGGSFTGMSIEEQSHYLQVAYQYLSKGEEIGVSIDEVSTNKHASLLGINRPMDGEEREVMQQFVNKTYSTFLTRVSDGRNIATTYVDSVGQGRIWSGEDALKLHLVDTLGGIDVAINKAAQLAKISSYRIESYPHMKNVWEEFAESMMNKTMLLSKQRAELGDMYMYFNYLQNSVQMNGVQAIIPFEFSIK